VTFDTSDGNKETVGKYLEAWAGAFTEVLRQIASPDSRATIDGESVGIERAREAVKDGFALSLVCSGALKGRQALRVSDADALTLARVLAGEDYGEADREAAAELLRQVAGQAAGRLRGQGGEEVGFQDGKSADGDWSAAAAAAIRLEGATPAPVLVLLEIDQELAEALLRRAETAARASTAVADSPAEPGETNLPLLLDIELEASIRFGQRELLLKDVLNLRPGTVVELARRVDEPAELLVGGRLVARGEVVVVEGNYGLRVTEILQPAERLAAIQG
jgi:flagellar motor switch protein FliN/FliY